MSEEIVIENDESVEQAGASNAVHFMKSHWKNLIAHLSKINTKEIQPECVLPVSSFESERLYKIFRSNFGLLQVDTLQEGCLKGQRWRDVLLSLQDRVKDYNMITLLRRYACLSYEDPAQELRLVPRATFLLIEIARMKEECYSTLTDTLIERQLELCLMDLLEARTTHEVAKTLISLSALQLGTMAKSAIRKYEAGKILRSLYETINEKHIKKAIVSLMHQWKTGLEIAEYRPALIFAEAQMNTIECANKILNLSDIPLINTKEYRAKLIINLRKFPLFYVKKQLLVAAFLCTDNDIQVLSNTYVSILIEKDKLMDILRVLILTFEECQQLSFISTVHGLPCGEHIERRVYNFLVRNLQKNPWLLQLSDLNKQKLSDFNSEETSIELFFTTGVEIAEMGPGDLEWESTFVSSDEIKTIEAAAVYGVEALSTKNVSGARNEFFRELFTMLVEGADISTVLEETQKEAYIAESDPADMCFKMLCHDERHGLQDKLNEHFWQKFDNHGFAVVDGLIQEPLLCEARRDMEYLQTQLNFNSQALKGMRRRDDSVTYVSDNSLKKLGCKSLSCVLQVLRAVPQLARESMNSSELYVPREIMFASYKGEGALHQSHRDNYPDKGDILDNGRALTAILYMNTDWNPSDGGEIRFQLNVPKKRNIDMTQYDPWLTEASKSSMDYRDFAPLGGRLIIFKSREMVHSVLPLKTNKTRMALTLWVTDKLLQPAFQFHQVRF